MLVAEDQPLCQGAYPVRVVDEQLRVGHEQLFLSLGECRPSPRMLPAPSEVSESYLFTLV